MILQIENIQAVSIPKFPQIKPEKSVMVPQTCNFVINDIDIDIRAQETLADILSRDVVIFSRDDLTRGIKESVIREKEKGGMVVFIANGGLDVKRSMPPQENSATVLVKRKERNRPERDIEDSDELLDGLASIKPERIRFVDDAIVSGETVSALRKYIVEKSDLNPSFFVSSWLMAYPRVKVSSGIEGILETNVSVLYKGEKGNTPLNSLSSFVLRSSESDQMIESYGNKYAKDTELLKTFIKSL